MADIFGYEVIGLRELLIKLQGEVDGAMQGRVNEAVSYETKQLELRVKDNIQSLFSNPNRMLDAISSSVESSTSSITGTVTAAGLPYLKIQEYGGTVQTPEIFPVNAKVLAFMSVSKLGFSGTKGNEMVFTKRTAAHPTTLPERSYMRRSLAERKADILRSIQMAARIP